MSYDIKTIRESLIMDADFFRNLAITVREEHPPLSFHYFTQGEICKQAAEELERMEPAEADMEGDRYSWHPVCGECHGLIDQSDTFCRHCGHPIKIN